MQEDPWERVAATAPSLEADPQIRTHIVERFRRKYLRAVLAARTMDAEERAWAGFYYWLVFPATARKPFELPETEADTIIAGYREMVSVIRQGKEVR